MLYPTNPSRAVGLEHAPTLRVVSSSAIAWPKSSRQSSEDLLEIFIRLRVGAERSVGHGPKTTHQMRVSTRVAARPA